MSAYARIGQADRPVDAAAEAESQHRLGERERWDDDAPAECSCYDPVSCEYDPAGPCSVCLAAGVA